MVGNTDNHFPKTAARFLQEPTLGHRPYLGANANLVLVVVGGGGGHLLKSCLTLCALMDCSTPGSRALLDAENNSHLSTELHSYHLYNGLAPSPGINLC